MTIPFTKEELKYLYFNGGIEIDEDCPKKLRESINKKLKKIKEMDNLKIKSLKE